MDAGTGPVVAASPSSQQAQSADTAFQAGELDKASQSARQAVALDPRNVVAYNVLGRAAAARFSKTQQAEDARQAEEAFRKAVALDPAFWPAFQNLGELAEAQGHLQAAATAYREVLRAQPDHPEKARLERAIAAGSAPDASD